MQGKASKNCFKTNKFRRQNTLINRGRKRHLSTSTNYACWVHCVLAHKLRKKRGTLKDGLCPVQPDPISCVCWQCSLGGVRSSDMVLLEQQHNIYRGNKNGVCGVTNLEAYKAFQTCLYSDIWCVLCFACLHNKPFCDILYPFMPTIVKLLMRMRILHCHRNVKYY